MRRITLLITLLLTACNLQQAPTPTNLPPTSTEANAQTAPSPNPAGQVTAPAQPTLQATPTQLILVTATLSAPPTTINAGSGTGVPTLDAASADERYPIEARAGASLGVNYEVTIGARGTVTMIVQGPDGILWQHTFTASEIGRADVQVEQSGTYEVLVFRENLDGSYAVSWD